MEINCWELKNGKEIPWPSTKTLNGFEWNARFRMTVSNDDGSLGLPFIFAADDTAILTVEKSEQEGKRTGNKKIKQVISCVPRSLGTEIVCSRTRYYDGNEHVWSAWEITSANSGVYVEWDMNADINTYVTAGIFNITGERLSAADGLPIENSAPGHTIHARLTVLDSSITGSGDNDDKCITQILALSNRTGGDGDVYIRTGRESMKNMLAGGSGWEPWGKLQQNVQVGQVTSLDGFTGNGMYSGVYTDGTLFETFVMVVINNYAVAGATGNVRSISQFKYALNVDGSFSYKTRTGRGGSSIEWGSWVDLGAATTTDIQDGAITAQKLSSEIRSNAVNPLRPLFIAAGAEYNDSGADKTKTAPWGETVTHKAGHYYLNGLGDITEEQMVRIYNRGNFNDADIAPFTDSFSHANNIRTNLPRVGRWNGTLQTFLCLSNNRMEVITFHVAKFSATEFCDIAIPNTSSLFEGSSKLSVIDTRCRLSSSNWAGSTFKDCTSLREVRIVKLKNNVAFAQSSLLSKESVRYAIENAKPTQAITITLHSDAYARLADDADVVAALEAQPLVSLVSA